MAIELGTGAARPQNTTTSQGSWLEKLNSIELTPRKVTGRERMFFTERLALLVETGNSLHASLLILVQQSDNPALSKLIQQLADDISGGMKFSSALTRHPDVFSPVYINLIAAAEQGGFMAEVLKELLALEEKRQELRSTVVGAFSYPAFLVVFSVAVVFFVLAVVFPKFAELFSSIADQLPASTLFLMAVSDAMREHWLAIVVGLGLTVGAGAYSLRQPWGIAWLDKTKLAVPVLRDIVVQIYLVQMMRVMHLSLRKEVSVQDTLQSCRLLVRNSQFRAFVESVQENVNAGRGVAVGFNASPFLPSLVKQMIATGDESGSLALVTGRIADFYERELQKRLATLSKLAEPIMLMVMGTVVGLLVSSLILPIFKLSRAVH